MAIVAGAYSISRGLAKAGSSDPYTETHDDSNGSRHQDREAGRRRISRRSVVRKPAGAL